MHFVPGSAIGPIFSATVEKGKKVLDMEMKRQDLSARSLTLGLPPCILAVDDDEMSLMMIERILGESYEIVKVTSGKDALAYLSEHTVDLVLLDYMMPENDGITVLRRIRETLETADLPVILLDVLDYMEKIPMVTAYKLTDGTTTTRFPMGEALDTAQPVVEYLPGWHCDITAARKWEDLPQQTRDYVEYLEKAVGCKITYISVGAEREAYIHRG